MAAERVAEAHVEELDDAAGFFDPEQAHLSLADLTEVPVTIAAELGRSRLRVRDILDLKIGSLVTLDKVAGEMADITLNGLNFSRGEVVVISDILHVRIAEILTNPGRTDRNNA